MLRLTDTRGSRGCPAAVHASRNRRICSAWSSWNGTPASSEDAGVPFHELQAEQIRRFRDAWTAAGHPREPRVSVSRSIFALVDDRDRAYFGRGNQESDQVGYIDAQTKAIFGRSYAAEPDVLVKELAGDTAIQAADTLLLTVPNQLGVEYNAHAIENILRFVAAELGWR